MFRPIARLCLGGLSVSLLFPLTLPAQGVPPLNRQVAALSQQVIEMRRELGQLRLEQEQLRRDFAALETAVEARLADDLATTAQLEALAARLRGEMTQTNDALRDTLIAEVATEVEGLAAQTEEALSALASAIEGRPRVSTQVTFSEDYPRTGIPYTVQSGDTLSAIASRHGSRVTWIRNANRLANDTILVGQELFIPQEN